MSRSGRWTGLASRPPVAAPASSATAVPRPARARGERGDRLNTGTIRWAGTPKATRSVITRTRPWTPLSDGPPTAKTTSARDAAVRAITLRSSTSMEPPPSSPSRSGSMSHTTTR